MHPCVRKALESLRAKNTSIVVDESIPPGFPKHPILKKIDICVDFFFDIDLILKWGSFSIF